METWWISLPSSLSLPPLLLSHIWSRKIQTFIADAFKKPYKARQKLFDTWYFTADISRKNWKCKTTLKSLDVTTLVVWVLVLRCNFMCMYFVILYIWFFLWNVIPFSCNLMKFYNTAISNFIRYHWQEFVLYNLSAQFFYSWNHYGALLNILWMVQKVIAKVKQ